MRSDPLVPCRHSDTHPLETLPRNTLSVSGSSATCLRVTPLVSEIRTAFLRNSSDHFSPIVSFLCCSKSNQSSGTKPRQGQLRSTRRVAPPKTADGRPLDCHPNNRAQRHNDMIRADKGGIGQVIFGPPLRNTASVASANACMASTPSSLTPPEGCRVFRKPLISPDGIPSDYRAMIMM